MYKVTIDIEVPLDGTSNYVDEKRIYEQLVEDLDVKAVVDVVNSFPKK